jgi:membrane-bound serine protease (ClpP class)
MLLALAIAGLFLLPSPWGVVVICIAAVIEVAEVFAWRRFLSSRYRIKTGAEALVGESAEVIEDCNPDGRVRLRGEIWGARSGVRVPAGATVRITAVDGLTLLVEPRP